MPTLSASERIGTTLGGRYEIRRLLGEGGFSAVFEAVHTFTGREVALKILHGHLTTTEQITDRFLMEARAMARIKHDGIVQVFDAGRDPDGTIFIALELLDGESLESTLLRVGRLTWGEAVSVCVDVLGALGEAHRHEIIHRDIKPGNIFIVRKPDGSSQAKLLDFGIAHVAQGKSKQTAAGMILGTPEYMSPEQGRTAKVGPESDLWAVGIVMWECLTGRTPFVADTATEILLRIATTTAPPILEEVPEMPSAVAAVIDRALERDVEKRWRSADEMREAMQRAMRRADEAFASSPARSPLRGDSGARPAPPSRTVPGGAATLPEATPVSPAPVPASPSRLGDPPRKPASPETPRESVAPRPVVAPSVPVGSVAGVKVVELPPERRRASVDRRVVEADEVAAAQETARRALAALEPPQPSPAGPPAPAPLRLPPSPAPPPRAPVLDLGATPTAEATPAASAAAARGSPPPVARPLTPEPRTYTGPSSTFQRPPETRRLTPQWIATGVLALGLISAGVVATLREEPPPPRPRTTTTRPADAAAPAPADVEEAPPAVQELTLTVINDVALPQGVTGADNASEFARHAVASGHAGTTQRVLATCVPNLESGAMLYLNPMTPGGMRGSSRGVVSCVGFDLAVLPDITNDGTDDIVALGPRRDRLLVIDSRDLQPSRTIGMSDVRGLAAGAHVRVRGEPMVVAFVEPDGPSAATEVRAVSALSSRTLWRLRGSGALARVGHPVELGLAVGADADGDGVGDVVVGLGPPLNVGRGDEGAQRCVQVHSGADGHALWPQPYCLRHNRSAQSVTLGPDVNGDGRADVALGCENPAEGDPPVVLLSGVDGRVLRRVATPAGELARGFGWPVALLGDMNGNSTPELVVGSVGETTGFTVFDTSTAQVVGRVTLGGVGQGNLRLTGVPPLVPGQPWHLVASDPAGGVRVYAPRAQEEPL